MPRREPGAADRTGRHARDRLQSRLGGTPLLDHGDGAEPFQYRGAAAAPGPVRGATPTALDCVPGGPAEPSGASAVPAAALSWHARLRWRVSMRAALLLAALAVAAGAWFWWQAASERPEVLPLSDIGSGGPAAEQDGSAEPAAEASEPDPAGAASGAVVVHVAGAVARPGVVQLPAGSRVHQAIAAAGGAAAGADLNRLNLALVLTDGQKIQVPRAGEDLPPETPAGGAGTGAEAGSGAASSGGADSAKVNLNTATLEELDALPKVGPVLAQRILDWRKEHGLFKTVEDLDAIDGVGSKMLETLLPLVTV